jgi:hypothetical protein
MAKFEFKTRGPANPETIEAADYNMDTAAGKLTFFDSNNDNLASYAIDAQAWVKRVSK